ncbi:MAG: hypothetical protein AB9907_14690 [Flexilinea sp.]
MGRNVGFSVADINEMTPAMILDAAVYDLNTQPAVHTEHGIGNTALQSDYDNF